MTTANTIIEGNSYCALGFTDPDIDPDGNSIFDIDKANAELQKQVESRWNISVEIADDHECLNTFVNGNHIPDLGRIKEASEELDKICENICTDESFFSAVV